MTQPETETYPAVTIPCQQCGKDHTGEFSHLNAYGDRGPIYAVICPVDNPGMLADYYTAETARK